MFLIVGLGNPGAKYKNTFHNVGFMVVDEFAKRNKLKFTKTECDAKVASGKVLGVDVVVAKPETFMNLSGESVRQLVRKYGIDEVAELIVVYDDLDLPVGSIRVRQEGSAGTHNGMRNIVKELYTTEFPRLRIGTKTQQVKDKEIEIIDFVLSKIDYETLNVLKGVIDTACIALEDFVKGLDFQRIEEKTNRRKNV